MTEYQSVQQSQSYKDKIFQLRRKKLAAEKNRDDFERQRIDLYAEIARRTEIKKQAGKDYDNAKDDSNQSEMDRLKALILDLDSQISEIEKERAKLKVDLDYWQGVVNGIKKEIRDLMDGSTPLSVPIKNESQASSSSNMLDLRANDLNVDTPREATGQKADPLDRSRFNLPTMKQKPGAMLGLPLRSDGLVPPKMVEAPTLPPRGDEVWPGTGPDLEEPILTSPGFPSPDDGIVPPIKMPEFSHTMDDFGAASDPAAEPWLEPDDLDDDEGTFGMPVLLDLNGDGIEIVPLGQSRAHFDIDGDGRKQIMAWVGPDDALLVYDRDGDRLISHRDEIAFADYLANAETDLEGLAYFDMAAHGGNEDGVLNALDALWSKFGVWRDVDQDGVTDPGELTMTGEGGLSSLNLQSDHISREAGPDARIHGKGAYQTTDADGRVRSGDLYDASLRYEQSPEPKSAAEIFYPSQPVKLTPEQQGYRRVRRDGQPLSKAEIFYPDESRAHEYTYVRNEQDEAVIQQQKNADLLYDHPTSNPKK